MRRKTTIKDDRALLLGMSERLKHAARNPSIEKYVPHEKQRIFHSSTKPGRLFLGGNRSGKTTGGGAETVMYARGIHPYKRLKWEPPLRLRVVTTDLTFGLEGIVLPEIKRWTPIGDLINGSWEDSYDRELRRLTYRNGSFIEFMTYEQTLEKFAGTSRHGIWFDEEPPKDIFTECKMRLLDVAGDWWITETPVEGMTWTYDDLYEAKDPLIDVIEVNMHENPHLSEEGKAQVLSGLDEEDRLKREKGQYVSAGGLIYPDFIHLPYPDGHIVPKHTPPVGALQVAGMDAGFTNATAWLWAYIDEAGRIVIFDEYYKRREIVQNHALAVHWHNLSHGHPPAYNVGDPSIQNKDPITGTSVQLEYIDNGVPIMPGNNDVRAGLDRVKKMINNRQLFVMENCVNLLWELKRYRWAVWKTSADKFDKNKKEEPQKKDDHACDALRYLIASRPVVEDLRAEPVDRSHLIQGSRAIDPSDGIVDRDVFSGPQKQHDEHLGVEY